MRQVALSVIKNNIEFYELHTGREKNNLNWLKNVQTKSLWKLSNYDSFVST